MATVNEIKKQKSGNYSVRIGNQKFNDLSKREAQRRSDANYQVRPDSETDSPNQKAKNLNLGIKPGDSNAMRDNAIRGSALQSNALINLPTPSPVKNEMGTIMGANASVVNPAMGVTAGQNGMLEYTAPQTGTGTTAENTFQQYLNSIQGLQNEAPSAEGMYNKLYKESGLRDIDKQISNLTSQINNITAKAQAESLGLEGQGRGITESIIGGQQAQISREAAIQALPLQALLANAQGNKELAQSHLDTRFKLQMEDAQNRFEYKTKLIDAVYSFADKQEQRRLEDIRRKEDQDFDLKKMNLQFDYSRRLKALDSVTSGGFGSNGVVSQIAANNPQLQGLSKDQQNKAVLTSLLQNKLIGQGTRTSVGAVLGVVNAAQDLAAQRVTGEFKGISPLNRLLDAKIPFIKIGLPFRETAKSQEAVQNRQYLDAINLNVQTWASGASLTKDQIDQVNRFTPTANDTDAKVQTKINGLVDFMLTQSASKLQSEGINFVPEKVDLFETARLIKETSPEQREALKAQGLIK